jgi:hypothetical protein
MKRGIHRSLIFNYSLLQIFFIILVVSQSAISRDLYVSIAGNDLNTGTKEQPYATIQKAIRESKEIVGKESVTIWIGDLLLVRNPHF